MSANDCCGAHMPTGLFCKRSAHGGKDHDWGIPAEEVAYAEELWRAMGCIPMIARLSIVREMRAAGLPPTRAAFDTLYEIIP